MHGATQTSAEPSGGSDTDVGGGLAGLLGDYGSDSDGEDAEAAPVSEDRQRKVTEQAGAVQADDLPCVGPVQAVQESRVEEELDYE